MIRLVHKISPLVHTFLYLFNNHFLWWEFQTQTKMHQWKSLSSLKAFLDLEELSWSVIKEQARGPITVLPSGKALLTEIAYKESGSSYDIDDDIVLGLKITYLLYYTYEKILTHSHNETRFLHVIQYKLIKILNEL